MDWFVSWNSISQFSTLWVTTLIPLVVLNVYKNSKDGESGKVKPIQEGQASNLERVDSFYSFHELCNNKNQEPRYLQFIENFSNFLTLPLSAEDGNALSIQRIGASFSDEYLFRKLDFIEKYRKGTRLKAKDFWELWIKDWSKEEGYSSIFYRADKRIEDGIQFFKCYDRKLYRFNTSFRLAKDKTLFLGSFVEDESEKLKDRQQLKWINDSLKLAFKPENQKLEYFVKFINAFGLCAVDSKCRKLFSSDRESHSEKIYPFLEIFNNLDSFEGFKNVIPVLIFPR